MGVEPRKVPAFKDMMGNKDSQKHSNMSGLLHGQHIVSSLLEMISVCALGNCHGEMSFLKLIALSLIDILNFV